MARYREGFEFSETGRLAEELLGGESIKPANSPQLVDAMYKNGELFHPRYKNNPKYREQIAMLPDALKALLDLAEQHERATNKDHKEKIREKMMEIKRHFSHRFLEEALFRYTINAHDSGYTPWAPGPLAGGRPRNQFIGELQETLSDHYNTDLENVLFYNAAGTPLDYMYSTDGFFVIDGSLFKDGAKRIMPIDLTISRSKESKEFNPSGSLILYLNPEHLDDEQLENYREDFAQRIMEVVPEGGVKGALDDFTSKFDRGEAA